MPAAVPPKKIRLICPKDPGEDMEEPGQAFLNYRRQGGFRTSPLPDFFIGAHAQDKGYALLTRAKGRYGSYFPTVTLICPSCPWQGKTT